MNTNEIMQKHLGNLSRLTGHDVSHKYSYIINQDDLTNAYLQMRNDLGYPLMIDSKYRRAIVYNKQGIERKIAEMINECIIANIKELESMMIEDVSKDIENMLNGITQSSHGVITLGKVNNKGCKSATNRFASALAKGLVKGVSKIIDDMTNPKDDRSR